ncbi:hypothetical protein LLG46_06380 [bacterium]|nr:hypothetical protein [bacterium]
MKKYLIGAILIGLLLSLAIGAGAQLQNVELHGYAQNRFYAPESGNARMTVDRVSLSAKGNISEAITGYLEVYFHQWMPNDVLPDNTTAEQYRTYLESAYVDMPLGLGRVRVGKGRQLNFGITPSYPNRKTSQYGIVPETFTQDRIVGIQYTQKTGLFDGGVTLYEDTSLGTRSIGEYPGVLAADVVKHFVDKDIPSDISGELAGSIRLGISKPCFQAHVSGALGKLNTTDTATMYTAYSLPAGTDDTHNKYGLDASYAHGNFVAQGEYYIGNYSFLKITGYNLLVGYTNKKLQRMYVRYNALNNDQTPTADQRTWDNQQWIFAFVQPIAKGVWAELEYEKNSANPGGGGKDPGNDLLFLELFTGF